MTPSPAARPKIAMWTDGSARGSNPSPHGGWAAILIDDGGKRIRALSGHYQKATNQRSEAYAALHGLRALKRSCDVDIYTDSMYVIRCIELVQRGMRRKNGKLPNANRDIWGQFPEVLARHTVRLHHVPGHSGVEQNDWADKLAYEAANLGVETDQYYDSLPSKRRRTPLVPV